MILGWKGIQSEQLQVSYCELYYASLWFWCL